MGPRAAGKCFPHVWGGASNHPVGLRNVCSSAYPQARMMRHSMFLAWEVLSLMLWRLRLLSNVVEIAHLIGEDCAGAAKSVIPPFSFPFLFPAPISLHRPLSFALYSLARSLCLSSFFLPVFLSSLSPLSQTTAPPDRLGLRACLPGGQKHRQGLPGH